MGICTRAKAKVSRANIDKCAHVYSRFLNVYLFTWETCANETQQKRTKEEYIKTLNYIKSPADCFLRLRNTLSVHAICIIQCPTKFQQCGIRTTISNKDNGNVKQGYLNFESIQFYGLVLDVMVMHQQCYLSARLCHDRVRCASNNPAPS